MFEEKIGKTNILGISVIKDLYVTIKFPISMNTYHLKSMQIFQNKKYTQIKQHIFDTKGGLKYSFKSFLIHEYMVKIHMIVPNGKQIF